MEEIESKIIKEKAYKTKLENGMEIIIVPKKNIKKKYVMWATHFGSIDNKFIIPTTDKEEHIPDGVAHFLEHKMFEQPDGTDSLTTLMALGIDANAYTTSDHTAYLFECINHFYEGLDELMNYVQHPYFTDKNVKKEQGIIGQEIMMYEDDPFWSSYINAMKCLYKNNPIRIDTAGSIESISHIKPEILYNCYNTFYNPANMVFVACGDFDPEDLLQEIKKRLLPHEKINEIKRIYPEEPTEINKKEIQTNMEISIPLFMIGYKDKIIDNKKELIKRHIAIEILLNILIGESSKLYTKLYNEELLLSEPDIDYEFSNIYAHILITGQSKNPKKIEEELLKEIERIKEQGINKEDFERTKRKIYGNYISEYNTPGDITRMFLSDWMKGLNSFDYIEEFTNVTIEYADKILREIFIENKEIISIVNPNNK